MSTIIYGVSHVLSRRTTHFRVASKNGLKEHAINMPFPTFGIFTYYDMIHIIHNIDTYWLLGENLANLSGDDVFDSLIVRLITKLSASRTC